MFRWLWKRLGSVHGWYFRVKLKDGTEHTFDGDDLEYSLTEAGAIVHGRLFRVELIECIELEMWYHLIGPVFFKEVIPMTPPD